ncbi:hypothetical protein NECAME_03013 [Necator americanus]|uniref:Uncharacterized protein n=1 Tax=Necator americanus TaxID=51031 RepID=W2T8V4_NECAM|nr:hypothetical protein NECAME_03013 [Necator americanus]ETN78054.1 hypothetical protein NECAME_03013 [Necator americanus]
MYMALLKKVLQDYMEAVKNGDPNAAAGMMSGFKGKAKFLLPLISYYFEGIDPPAVLTHLDPSTGMPAFATASKENFSDYIEQAAERKADEEKKELQRLTQLLEQNMVKSGMDARSTNSLEAQKMLNSTDSYCQTTSVTLDPEMNSCETQTTTVSLLEQETEQLPASLAPVSTAEVNFTLSLVNRPVDENGDDVRESFDERVEHSEGEDDVFLPDNEIEELEQFLVEESTQTDGSPCNEDKNQQTTPLDVGSSSNVPCQTSPVHLNDVVVWEVEDGECSQTEHWIVKPAASNSEAQTVSNTKNCMVQCDDEENDKNKMATCDPTSFTNVETQTSELVMISAEAQAETVRPAMESGGCQTDTFLPECDDMKPECKSCKVQSDVSMFTVTNEIDEIEVDSVYVQCTPTVSTSQTQHNSSCLTDEFVQTEMCMKNKKNQECEVSVETRDVFAQGSPDCKEESVQAVTDITDTIMDTSELGGTDNTVVQTPAALWSDFDRTTFMDFYQDVSQQTSPRMMNDNETQFTLDFVSRETQTLDLKDVSDKCCGASVDKEDNGAQAAVELHEVASGQPDSESWIKVYLAELDAERLSKMMDVGIQTGVLVRVEHLYAPEELETDEQDLFELSPSSLNNLEETGSATTRKRLLKRRASEYSSVSRPRLPPKDHQLPPVQRLHSTFAKIPSKSKNAPAHMSIRVSDLRSRFEQKNANAQPRTRSSSHESDRRSMV